MTSLHRVHPTIQPYWKIRSDGFAGLIEERFRVGEVLLGAVLSF